ncbi:hypothetical protein EDB89DRAFT_2077579 [Lactarius sanguifluus]|nr:hypothetical protein EDB89DRAFT_2077579 [Lactarius sanguifluus]
MALAMTKVALITGAARGIGRAIALRLADDGLDVAVNDRSSSPELDELVREIKGKGRRSLAVPADVSLEPEVENSVRKVVQDLGSLDVMVANAGIVGFEPFLDTLELGKYGITVNAYAPGIVETPMIAEARGHFGTDGLSRLIASTLVNRIGTPEEIAGLVSYLASNGSGFVTGQSISINGGSFFD